LLVTSDSSCEALFRVNFVLRFGFGLVAAATVSEVMFDVTHPSAARPPVSDGPL